MSLRQSLRNATPLQKLPDPSVGKHNSEQKMTLPTLFRPVPMSVDTESNREMSKVSRTEPTAQTSVWVRVLSDLARLPVDPAACETATGRGAVGAIPDKPTRAKLCLDATDWTLTAIEKLTAHMRGLGCPGDRSEPTLPMSRPVFRRYVPVNRTMLDDAKVNRSLICVRFMARRFIKEPSWRLDLQCKEPLPTLRALLEALHVMYDVLSNVTIDFEVHAAGILQGLANPRRGRRPRGLLRWDPYPTSI